MTAPLDQDAAPARPLRLALTRHGQTDWNAEQRFQGSSDVPLNEVGREQARESARRFADGGWDAVATSPLSRAAETGRIIADHLAIPLLGAYADLVERDYGEAEGVVEAEAALRWPHLESAGLESRDSVAERALRALDVIAADAPGSSVIVVAHGTLIRESLRRMTSAAIPPILNAATSTIERTDGGWRVLTVNDVELSAI